MTEENGSEEDLTERDVLLALVMEALDGAPVDVVATVTTLGYGALVEEARMLAAIEAADEADGAGGVPLDDPDADDIAAGLDGEDSDDGAAES